MIRSRLLLMLFIIVTTQSIYAQESFDCSSIDDTGLITKAFQSFEKDIFSHYNFGNDSIKTYRTFLAEVASLSIDLKKLPSKNSITHTRLFKKGVKNKGSIWIPLSEYENQRAENKTATTVAKKKNEEAIMIFNYRGGFIQCLKNTSKGDNLREIIDILEEDGNVSTSLIAQRIYYIPDSEFNSISVKKFIAFDIYYSILMVIEKAFG
ncbi:hypothetical protein ACJRPK_14255 [Aquimarina sp. 2-A2]|uniref:Uncharacterized protein n=1 Tax=Aquimarina intermedia TaxID=350814 RepID=A0A5S5C0Y6_9FLAO|nr:hypothetical protein [Aquimarina intermedia]TYP72839.1 hypothetical protein BD809_10689 [Aquimarina intermedia]